MEETALQELSRDQLLAIIGRLTVDNQRNPNENPPDIQASAKKTRKPKKFEQPIQYWTDVETDAFFRVVRATRNLRNIALFEVLYHRGLRASEIGLLQITDLQLSKETLFCRALKGGNSAEALLTAREVKAIRAWLKIRGTRPGPIFTSRKHGPLKRTEIFRLTKKYAAAAGIPEDKRHPHCARHSCATHLFDRDVDIREVQHHLRHSDIRNTQRYTQVTDKKRRQTAERLYRDW